MKFTFLVFLGNNKPSPTGGGYFKVSYKSFRVFFVICLCLLFPFNSFAGRIIDFRKIREAYERWTNPSTNLSDDFMVSSYANQNPNTIGKLRALLKINGEDFLPEDASRQEVFENFRDVFKRTDKGTDLHTEYTEVIFSSWEDVEFRGFILDSITGEDLYEPDFLLKWWKEAKAVGGVESRLNEYTEASLNRIKTTREPDPFMDAAFLAANENEDFRWAWNLSMRGIEGIDDDTGVKILWDVQAFRQDYDDV